jgi:hypothetical protein
VEADARKRSLFVMKLLRTKPLKLAGADGAGTVLYAPGPGVAADSLPTGSLRSVDELKGSCGMRTCERGEAERS